MNSSENYNPYLVDEPEYDHEGSYEVVYEADDWVNELARYYWPYAAPRWAIIGLVLLLVFMTGFMFGRLSAPDANAETRAPAFVVTPIMTATPLPPVSVIPPYDEYAVTQGPHGATYGHLAVDIAAGKGSTILAPIDGEVRAVYVDQYGNTRIILENDRYEVTMLHGIYTPKQGDQVSQGEAIGVESNQGYTTDMRGVSCAGRDCGYHTHINVFDKLLRTNVNPLDLFAIAEAE